MRRLSGLAPNPVRYGTKAHEALEEMESKLHGEVRVRNSLLVEGYNASGDLVAKAVRATELHNWYIGANRKGKWDNEAIVMSHMPEVLQRKCVLAIMRELV